MRERDRPVYWWLLGGAALIALMVIVGGITRLTGSGLSITEWDLLGGALPPRTDAAWQTLLGKYLASPQGRLDNAHFALADFKQVFWWEWIHRFLGRSIGVVFLVPFAFFVATRRVTWPLTGRLVLILAMGAAQGLMGWLMVASGLVDDPRVSHYRLAAHLLLAFATFGVVVWTAMELSAGRWANSPGRAGARLEPAPARLPALLFLALLGIQVTYGAFVAGLRAGFQYNTFPTMAGELVPPGMGGTSPLAALTSNPVTVQFVHRWLALAVLGTALLYWLRWRREPGLASATRWMAGLALAQFGLGVLTILRLPANPVFWGTVHQSGALALLTAALAVHFRASGSIPSRPAPASGTPATSSAAHSGG
ncbi:MAG: COX15/CtaA family protein [Gemmatimonadales bacterium]